MWRAVILMLLAVSCARPCPRRVASAVRCVVPSDCPRPANTLQCTTEEDRFQGCVGCEGTVCVEYVPEACP